MAKKIMYASLLINFQIPMTVSEKLAVKKQGWWSWKSLWRISQHCTILTYKWSFFRYVDQLLTIIDHLVDIIKEIPLLLLEKNCILGLLHTVDISSTTYLLESLLRLEFQVAHPILNVTLATDQKWPLIQIYIS